LRRALRHPTWATETIRRALRRRREEKEPFSLSSYRQYLASEEEGVIAITGRSGAEYREACDGLISLVPSSVRGPRPICGGRAELIRIVAGVVRLTEPERVVETGVAQGVTTAAILLMMERNGRGHLYSVDLPVLYADENDFVGRLVPQRLRHRWTLKIGPSRKVLPSLVERAAPFDVFLHDSDHTYRSQLEEYRTAWPHLQAGGILVSDDVSNPAFPEFAAEVSCRPYLVGDAEGSSAVGLIRKD